MHKIAGIACSISFVAVGLLISPAAVLIALGSAMFGCGFGMFLAGGTGG